MESDTSAGPVITEANQTGVDGIAFVKPGRLTRLARDRAD
jgi:hypothetical protein